MTVNKLIVGYLENKVPDKLMILKNVDRYANQSGTIKTLEFNEIDYKKFTEI